MTNTLIIFVDSLPFLLLPRLPFLSEASEAWSIRPGFGYSVNIHAELFAGLLPDDIGYFGEWMYNPRQAPGRNLRPVLPILDAIFRPYILNRGLQHLLTRNYRPGHPMPNIPLRHLDKFAMEGHHIQSPDFPHPTLFTQFPQLYALQYRGMGVEKGRRDSILFQRGMEAIPEHAQLFIPFPDLDGFGHQYGIDHPVYQQHLEMLDSWIQRLCQQFVNTYPQAHIFIVSDHGMANVTRGVYLDIEEILGPATEKTYLYFSDANLLRVWVFDPTIKLAIRDYLESQDYGRLLSVEERKEYGLTSARFGDFIFVLEEGLAFSPSTFARNIPKGMHGYHPDNPQQHGVLIHMGHPLPPPAPRTMRDVYHRMSHTLAAPL